MPLKKGNGLRGIDKIGVVRSGVCVCFIGVGSGALEGNIV